VLKSLIDANDLIKKDPNAAAALIAERIKVDPEIVRNFLPRTRFNIDLERADLVAELQTQAKWAIDNKLVRPDVKVPDFNTVVVGSLLDKAREK
jgi:NitT/TauT family transport system substrate-binding protein